MVPPQRPRAHKTLLERETMIALIDHYLRQSPKLDFEFLCPGRKRCHPKWIGHTSEYFSYGERCAQLEINPAAPLDHHSSNSLNADGTFPWWCTPKFFSHFFSLAGFYLGSLSDEYIQNALPACLQGNLEHNGLASDIAKAIKRVSGGKNGIYTAMITTSIKPITMYFLKHPAWITADTQGRLPSFFHQADRIIYFRARLQEEPWILAWWLSKSVPYMLRVRWLFQTEPPTDPRLLALKTTLNTLFEERFLLLVDAAYLYLIDQDLTRKRGPKWDADRKEVQLVINSLPTHPSLKNLTPPLDDLPIHSTMPTRVKNIWR